MADAAPVQVCVLGGGVIGLTTALRLLEQPRAGGGPPLAVTVVADAWSPDTTSDGAGAFWERRKDSHARWARATMEHYKRLLAAGRGDETGVGLIDGVNFSHEDTQYDGFAEDVPAFRACTPEEVAAASAATGEPFRSGVRWTSVIVDSPRYLRWLMREVVRLGGRLAHARVDGLPALADHFHVVVNATGHAARELAGDASCHAYRGQVIRVWAPHVTEFATSSAGVGAEWHNTYVLPRPTSGVVTCGGTYQKDREFTGVDPGDRAGIWARCVALVPALASGVVIDDWAGLRPGRDGDVRIELEHVPLPSSSPSSPPPPLPVVHAYGHGGCGHSLHVGTADDAVALVGTAVAQLAPGAPKKPFVAPEPVLRPSVHLLVPDLAKAAGPDAVAALLAAQTALK
jgi:D-amino-acid oxidase